MALKEVTKMAILRWQRPWDPFAEFQREVNRLLSPGWSRRAPGTFSALNMHECDDHYELTAELPGVRRDQIELSVTGGELSLRIERSRLDGVAENQYRRQERMFGSWHRTVALPEKVEHAKVEAHFRNGVLTIVLPKHEEVKPRQIAVNA